MPSSSSDRAYRHFDRLNRLNRRHLIVRAAAGAGALAVATLLPPILAYADDTQAGAQADVPAPDQPTPDQPTPETAPEAAPSATLELDLINAYRAAAGAPPASIHPALLLSAQRHVAYYDANRGDAALNGMGLHEERPDAPGFFGATMGDRARAAGYGSGSVTENAGFGSLASALEWYMSTVNHRLPLIHPNAVDMGFAVSPVSGFGIVSVGLRRDKLTVSLPSVYPADGAANVARTWDGGETPDPAPGVKRPLGAPITVAFGVAQRVDWQDFALIGPDGLVVPIATPKTDWMRAAAIIPLQPLLPQAPYTAHVSAVVDGKWVVKDWTFTTRS